MCIDVVYLVQLCQKTILEYGNLFENQYSDGEAYISACNIKILHYLCFMKGIYFEEKGMLLLERRGITKAEFARRIILRLFGELQRCWRCRLHCWSAM